MVATDVVCVHCGGFVTVRLTNKGVSDSDLVVSGEHKDYDRCVSHLKERVDTLETVVATLVRSNAQHHHKGGSYENK